MTFDKFYHAHGVRFSYPGHWELTEESSDDATTISVGDAGAFWSLTILKRRPRAEKVLEEAVQAFRDEYDEVDEYPVGATIGGETAQGKNLEFVALELISCVFLRTLEVGGRTLFVMAQVTDHERDDFEPLFEAVAVSVEIDPDDQIEVQ